MLHKLKRKVSVIKHNNILIHIGKCGGSSLRTAIQQSDKLRVTDVIHVTKPVFLKNKNYYIVARDPISRCMSAFNWRYKLVVVDQSQKDRFKGEYEILKKYETLNNISEKLYDTSGNLHLEAASEFEKIHHLHERISFYLKDFLVKCPHTRIKGVLMQETLNHDIEKHFGVNSNKIGQEKRNKRDTGNDLSSLGKQNLVRYLHDDYNCLFHLYSLGHIQSDIMFEIYKNTVPN